MRDEDYKPDWDNIPKEFKYCYVAKFEHGKCVQLRTHQKDQYHSTWIEHRRPPELVEDAWYAVTDTHGSKRMGKYCANKMNLGGSYWVNTSELTIHQRIPDSMWECEDEQ